MTCIIIPVIIGSVIDIGISQTAGSQYCSFKDFQNVCKFSHGLEMPSIYRELGRSVLQLIIIIILVFAIQKLVPSYYRQLYTTFAGIVAIIAFMHTQGDLFEDFRRFNNSVLFKIKHN